MLSCVSAAPELEGGGYSEEGLGHSSQPHPSRRNLGMRTFPRYKLLKIRNADTNLHQRGCFYVAGKTIQHCNQTRDNSCTASLSSRCRSMPCDLQKVRNQKKKVICVPLTRGCRAASAILIAGQIRSKKARASFRKSRTFLSMPSSSSPIRHCILQTPSASA